MKPVLFGVCNLPFLSTASGLSHHRRRCHACQRRVLLFSEGHLASLAVTLEVVLGLGHVSVTSFVVEPGAWPRGCGGPGGGGQCPEAGGWGAHGSVPTRCVGQGIQNRGSVPHSYTRAPLGLCAHMPFLSRFRTESHKAFKGQLSSWSCPVGFGERDRGTEEAPYACNRGRQGRPETWPSVRPPAHPRMLGPHRFHVPELHTGRLVRNLPQT